MKKKNYKAAKVSCRHNLANEFILVYWPPELSILIVTLFKKKKRKLNEQYQANFVHHAICFLRPILFLFLGQAHYMCILSNSKGKLQAGLVELSASPLTSIEPIRSRQNYHYVPTEIAGEAALKEPDVVFWPPHKCNIPTMYHGANKSCPNLK